VKKRIGVADRRVASCGQAHALTTVHGEGQCSALCAAIAALIDEWQPSNLVVGRPLSLDGGVHTMTARCERFANQLRGRFRLQRRLCRRTAFLGSKHGARLRSQPVTTRARPASILMPSPRSSSCRTISIAPATAARAHDPALQLSSGAPLPLFLDPFTSPRRAHRCQPFNFLTPTHNAENSLNSSDPGCDSRTRSWSAFTAVASGLARRLHDLLGTEQRDRPDRCLFLP
jgi:hypothetical protein